MAVGEYNVRATSDFEIDNEHIPGAYAYKSNDYGKTFIPLGKDDMPDRSFDKHIILEKKNGILAMYVRTHYGVGVSYPDLK